MEILSYLTSPLFLTLFALVVINLGLIWLFMIAPVGVRTVKLSKLIAGSPQRVWSALFPLGENAKWDGNLVSANEIAPHIVELEIAYDGRDGKPIRRTVQLAEVLENCHFSQTTVDDTSLDISFWKSHSETVLIEAVGSGSRVTLTETDRYKGFAFLVFRYFKNRRQLATLAGWAKTGVYTSVGIFEKPPVQVAMAALSAIILWPFFGLTKPGLLLSVILTIVVALHEAGHMFAFRVMGHKSARMIFIPLLGGIALGGRPYDKYFEVGFSALMGAGMSVFPVAAAVALYVPFDAMGWTNAATITGIFATIGAVFNLGNLVPVWKFDGGQVIRQVFADKASQGVASFILLAGLLGVGWLGGFSPKSLILAGVIFSLLSIMTTGSGVKPKHDLKPMSSNERILLFTGLVASFMAHSACALWGFATLL